MTEEIICEGTYFDGWHRYRCRNRGKFLTDGKWYCGMHDPIRVQEKRDKRNAEWRCKWEKEQKEDLLKKEKEEYNNLAGLYCKTKGISIKELKELNLQEEQ